MRDIIIDFQESETLKIQLKIAIDFISSKYAEEVCVMHSKGDIKLHFITMQMKLLRNSLSHFVQDIKVI